MLPAALSAVVLFDAEIPALAEPRQLRLFVDGTYQESHLLAPGERRTLGPLHAPRGAFVRLEVVDAQLRSVSRVSFIASPERQTIEGSAAIVRVRGELFGSARAAA